MCHTSCTFGAASVCCRFITIISSSLTVGFGSYLIFTSCFVCFLPFVAARLHPTNITSIANVNAFLIEITHNFFFVRSNLSTFWSHFLCTITRKIWSEEKIRENPVYNKMKRHSLNIIACRARSSENPIFFVLFYLQFVSFSW